MVDVVFEMSVLAVVERMVVSATVGVNVVGTVVRVVAVFVVEREDVDVATVKRLGDERKMRRTKREKKR